MNTRAIRDYFSTNMNQSPFEKIYRLIPLFIVSILDVYLLYQYYTSDLAIRGKNVFGLILTIINALIVVWNFEYGLLFLTAFLALGSIGLVSITKVFTTCGFGINGHDFILNFQPIFVELLIFHLLINGKRLYMICRLYIKSSS